MMEQVLIVDRDKLLGGKALPHGLKKTGLKALVARIYKFGRFVNRPYAENNPDLKQIIPYMLMQYQDRFFLLHRWATQTEKRLHNKYSLGVGGHINPVKGMRSIRGIIEKGLERELHEELSVKCPYKYKLVAYLNDDSNSVGQVHLGLIYIVTVKDGAKVKVAETELMAGRFASRQEIAPQYNLMETWSQILYDNLIAGKK
ncbi:MAG: DNA mismatch repair protein MutT [Planctomycetota bacterium]